MITISYSFRNVTEAIFSHAATMPDKPALIYESKEITYAELKKRAVATALRFLSLGIGYGDAVLYAMRTNPAFFETYLAAGMLGAVSVGVPARATADAASVIVEKIRPKAVVCDAALAETYRSLVPAGVPVYTCEELVPAAPDCSLSSALTEAEARVGRDTPFLILFTSGTTKKPKGAILTHGNVLAEAWMQNKNMFRGEFSSDAVVQHCLPVNHVSGGVECGTAPLIGGATMILLPEFHPVKLLENSEKYRANVICGVPAMWVKMLEVLSQKSYDLSSVRYTVTGASMLPPALAGKMTALFGVPENMLGMTELSGCCSYYPDDPDLPHLSESVGRIMPELSYKIVDTDGNRVKTGEIGQICYKGDSVIPGYVGEPLPRDAEGYFLSGDLAREDENGLIFLAGRNDDMFTVGGYNVYPQEIEEALTRIPTVTGAAVLPIPHHSMGNVCRAYITVSQKTDTKAIEERLGKELIYYKVPRDYVILESFPRNALGKISRKALAAEIEKEFALV